MSLCRICLIDSAEKSITELEVNGKTNSYKDVLLFCLDIWVNEEDNGCTKLCLKCYKNVHLFYEFKSLAQKNDVYWKSIKCDSKSDMDGISVNEIKCEEPLIKDSLSVNNDSDSEFNENIDIKIEGVEYCESDDELLSVIKMIKDERGDGSEDLEHSGHGKAQKTRILSPKTTNILEPVKRQKKVKKKYPSKEQICEECGKTVRNLKEHMTQHLPEGEKKKYKCKVCDKVFSTYGARYKHNRVKHIGVKKKCDVCNKEVVCLWSHKLRVHEASRQAHACPVCARRFVSPSLLHAHARTHSAARPYRCDQCDKAFATNLVMVQHKRQVHDKEKSHLCQICSKSFFKKYHLQVHLRSHSKEKPYRCGACGKFFSSSTTLKNHKRLHSDLKMFACQLCDMAFKAPGYLRNHMISHTKVKNHPCRYCGLKFGRSDHKRRHERAAHEKHLLSAEITPFDL